MKQIFKPSLLLTLLISIYSCSNNETEINQTKVDETVKRLHAELQNTINYEVPSLSVYMITPKGTYFSTATGSNGEVMTENTNFRFASNTKNFTATAILKMMQDGWLNIDDLITANIPGTNIPYTPTTADWNFPNKNSITILQLLQHNAGVYDLTNDNSLLNYNGLTYHAHQLNQNPIHQFSTTEYVSILTSNNLLYGPPNAQYHYSNTGYSILGEIIRRIYSEKSGSEKTLTDYFYDYIMGPNTKVPLNITFPELASDQQLPQPYVKGHMLSNEGLEVTDYKNLSGNVAEGNGIGTMKELSKYIRSLLKGENVLNAQSVELMKTKKGPATTVNNYALGGFHLENIGFGHNGAIEGYLSLMMHDTQTDVTSIVMLPFIDFRNQNLNEKLMPIMNRAASESKAALGY